MLSLIENKINLFLIPIYVSYLQSKPNVEITCFVFSCLLCFLLAVQASKKHNRTNKIPSRHNKRALDRFASAATSPSLLNSVFSFFLQITRINQECNPGQRFHEEPGNDTDSRDCGLHVPSWICCRQPHHQGRRCWQHCIRYGGWVSKFILLRHLAWSSKTKFATAI